jgi:hypothetical protein
LYCYYNKKEKELKKRSGSAGRGGKGSKKKNTGAASPVFF